MFRQIVVAVDESREASRALEVAVHLARQLGSGLRAISVIEPLPSYTTFATVADSSVPQSLAEDRQYTYEVLLANAREYALSEDVHLATDLLEGAEVKAIVDYIISNENRSPGHWPSSS